jgi:hypothetical protein
VCVIAAARDGQTLAVFEGKAEGAILEVPCGVNGFGYDPFFVPANSENLRRIDGRREGQLQPSWRGIPAARLTTYGLWYRRDLRRPESALLHSIL